MKSLKFLVFVFLIVMSFDAYASSKKYTPIVITRPIRLKIVNANKVSINGNFDKFKNDSKNLNSTKIESKNLKIEISFSKGKFSQINENVVIKGKKIKEKCIKPYPDETKIVRKYDEFKNIKNGKLILTFISF